MGGKSEGVLIGGKSPKVQNASKRNWTKEKEQEFLTVLAETCNVTRACETAGVATSQAYRRKSENAAFRAAWLAAVSVAYQRLELMLLDRAFNGTEGSSRARTAVRTGCANIPTSWDCSC